MAKQKKPSMLARQRQLRAQKEQVKKASSKNLPPSGGSGGGKGGKLATSGDRPGALTKSGSGKVADMRIQPVRVREVKPQPPKMSGGNPPKLPGGAKEMAGSAVRGALKGTAKQGLKKFAGPVGAAAAAAEQAGKVFNPKDNLVTRMRDLASSISSGGKVGPGHSRYNPPKADNEKVGPPAPTPESIKQYRDERDVRHMGQRAALQRDFPAQKSSGSSGSTSGGGSSGSKSTSSTPSKPAVKQSGDMGKNYEAWTKANRKLAEKVKPGQAGYEAIQKALGKSSSTNGSMKIQTPESKQGSASTAGKPSSQEASIDKSVKEKNVSEFKIPEYMKRKKKTQSA